MSILVKMAMVKKLSDGKYYVCVRKKGKEKNIKSVFFVKTNHKYSGMVALTKNLSLPKELIGKRIRLIVKIL